jgi:hypothetical protein
VLTTGYPGTTGNPGERTNIISMSAKSHEPQVESHGDGTMERPFGCILTIAGWYLLYPSAIHNGSPDSYTALSQWNIDGSYSTQTDCREAHYGDLTALQGLDQNSTDFLQTQGGRCIAAR